MCNVSDAGSIGIQYIYMRNAKQTGYNLLESGGLGAISSASVASLAAEGSEAGVSEQQSRRALGGASSCIDITPCGEADNGPSNYEPKAVPMKKLNPYEIFLFGQRIAPLSKIQEQVTVKDILFELWFARVSLLEFVSQGSFLPFASKQAANSLMQAIDNAIPRDFQAIQQDKQLTWNDTYELRHKSDELATVLNADMPGIATFFVSQKGIYKTEDLITNAEHALLEGIRKELSEQVVNDLRSAGKCLAYELPIACAFHLFRAIEEVMRSYYHVLTGKTFKENKISRNWGAYIKALSDSGADNKVTQFLEHIRVEYRNPQTHPDASVTIEEAYGLFGAALSSITQIVLSTEEAKKQKKLTVISGAISP